MKVVLLPSTGGRPRLQPLSTYVIDGTVAVDAGALGLFGPVAKQRRIRHVFLTHSHIDHVASLPLFLDNVYGTFRDGVQVYGLPATLDCLRRHLFNDHVWPDFERLAAEVERPWLRLVALVPGVPVPADGLRITPVAVDHVVPTVAFLVEAPDAAVAVVTDTRPTDEIWNRASAAELKGVFLEASFPEELAELAAVSKHLTPSLFMAEVAKLPAGVPVIATHLKPAYHAQVAAELRAYRNRRVRVGRPGAVYRFPARPSVD